MRRAAWLALLLAACDSSNGPTPTDSAIHPADASIADVRGDPDVDVDLDVDRDLDADAIVDVTADATSDAGADLCLGVTCDPIDGCHLPGTCDPATGLCSTSTAAPDGTTCDDRDACTAPDTCVGGTCTPGPPLTCDTPGNCEGHPGRCDPSRGCVYPRLPDLQHCNDGSLCTVIDLCMAGACVGLNPITCSPDAEICHLPAQCDPQTAACIEPAAPDGTGCDDENVCTQTDVCMGGECTGTNRVVPQGTPCQHGICFTEVASQSGLTWTSTTTGTIYISASGALLDHDGDGLEDILIASDSTSPALYRNLGNGAFSEVTSAAGVPPTEPNTQHMGFAAADYDNDGDTDVYVAIRGPDQLLRNNGDGTFTDVASQAGLRDNAWTTAAAFGDYDRDGDLDLYVGNYIQSPNYPNHVPFPSHLYRNDGNDTFTDVTAQHRVANNGTTLAVSWSDYDGDGWLDLIVCNDFGAFVAPNRLYRNTGTTFTDVAASAGAAIAIYCMGIAAADYDRDRDLDYYFTNIGRNVFLENRGAMGFADVTTQTGTELIYDPCLTRLFTTSWGDGFHDFDSDGWMDLYVSNGHVPAAAVIANAERSGKSLFKHLGAQLRFADISHTAGVAADERIGRAAAFGDYDQDGDVDVLQVNIDGAPSLWRNDSPAQGNRAHVVARGRISNRDAIGLRLTAEMPGYALVREVNPNYSFSSSSSKTVHFGLGTAAEIPLLAARWPSGIVQYILHVPAETSVSLIEPVLTVASATAAPALLHEGDAVNVALSLRSHVSFDLTAGYHVALRLSTGAVAAQSGGTLILPAASASGGATSIAIPEGVTSGVRIDAEIVLTAGDIDGGSDQRAFPIVIDP